MSGSTAAANIRLRALRRRDRPASPVAEIRADDAVCVMCGCTDSHACAEGCSWAMVDRAKRRGVCSRCVPSALAKLDRTR